MSDTITKERFKPIDGSWMDRAVKDSEDSESAIVNYHRGASDFRRQSLDALSIFSALSVEEPVIHNGMVYVSLDDVIVLIEGLYSEPKKRRPRTPKKDK